MTATTAALDFRALVDQRVREARQRGEAPPRTSLVGAVKVAGHVWRRLKR